MATLYKRGDSPNWQAEYTEHSGKRVQRTTGTASKKRAREIVANWESDANDRRKGLIDPAAERLILQLNRPIDEHLTEWINSLQSKGDTSDYVERCKMHIQKLIDAKSIATLVGLTSEAAESRAAAMRQAGSKPRTVAAHLRSLKSFSRWCHRTGRINQDPLISISLPNPNTDRAIRRRAMPVDQWRALESYLSTAPVRHHLTGPARAVLYHTSLITGLRATELSTLTTSDLHLLGATPYLMASASQTKNRKTARQYLTSRLTEQIQRLTLDRSGPVFDGMPSSDETADMLRTDIAAARASMISQDESIESTDFLTELNAAGERYDFHALRHTCGAWLIQSGAGVKVVQTVMRHATITLTYDTYGHLFPGDEATAIANLGKHVDTQPPQVSERQ